MLSRSTPTARATLRSAPLQSSTAERLSPSYSTTWLSVLSLLALLVQKQYSRALVALLQHDLALWYSVYLLYWYKSSTAERLSPSYSTTWLSVLSLLALLVQKYKN